MKRPKNIVTAQEISTTVLRAIVDKFDGRIVEIDVAVHGLSIAIYQLRVLATRELLDEQKLNRKRKKHATG